MKIMLIIFPRFKKGCSNEPQKITYSGNTALETMLIQTTEKYFGSEISLKLESMLKTRQPKIGDD